MTWYFRFSVRKSIVWAGTFATSILIRCRGRSGRPGFVTTLTCHLSTETIADSGSLFLSFGDLTVAFNPYLPLRWSISAEARFFKSALSKSLPPAKSRSSLSRGAL